MTGGPERYLFSITKKLESEGHTVIPFSVLYEQSEATEYSKYFVPPPSKTGREIFFKDFDFSWREKVKFAVNTIYSLPAKTRLQQLLADERPDVVNLLELHNVLSPSVIHAGKKFSVPIVMRLSEYHLLCPAYHFFREGMICEECRRGKYHALRHRCIKRSLAATSVKVMSAYLHQWLSTYDKVDAFIAPSRFLKDKLVENGFREDRIVHVPSFINVDEYRPNYGCEDYVVYFGRIAKEKGVFDLIRAFEGIATRLLIVGSSTDGHEALLQAYVRERNLTNIQFVGHQSGEALHELVRNAMFTVCPSIWYENTPMSIYESFALGKPVIATRIGSLPEQIEESKDGLLFELGNVEDLRDKIQYLLDHTRLLPEMGKRARRKVEAKYNADTHYQNLLAVYQSVMR